MWPNESSNCWSCSPRSQPRERERESNSGSAAVDFEKLRLILGDDVEDGDERYAFTWPGKKDAIRQSQTVSTATLRPCPEESVDWDTTQNLYIEGDNLEVLKLLQRSYHGRVKLIYIDPPYNTGHDFVYKDKFGDTIENYREQAGTTQQSNSDSSGRYHSSWCSMMYPRLRLAREVLADEGVIFISIDDNEVKNLRSICDEVFSEACFVADIAWQKTYSPKNNSTGIPAEVEHIIAYSKYPDWVPLRLPRTEDMNEGYKNPDNDVSPWASDNPFAPGASTHQGMVYAIQNPFTGKLIYPPSGRCWCYEQSTILDIMSGWGDYELVELDDDVLRASLCGTTPESVRKHVCSIVLRQSIDSARKTAQDVLDNGPWPKFYFTKNGEGGIRRKTYLDGLEGRLATNLWPFSEVGHNDEAKKALKGLFDGNAPFDTPKPARLMKRMLDIASDDASIVLDFFSGSATMAEATIRKNAEDSGHRRFILIQLPEAVDGSFETICEIGKERIRRAGAKIAAEIEEANKQLRLGEEPKPVPDIGFRVLKLDESSIVKPKPGQLLFDRIKPDRTDLDVIFEMMLKWGMELTHPVEEDEINGYPIYSVGDGALICCMKDGLTVEILEAVADLEPDRVFILDSILTDTLKLNALQIFKRVEERTQYKIDLRTI